MAAQVKARPRQIDFSHILVIGAWGFAIVIASMLFLYVGHLIDEMLHTPPTFMLGLFFLGLALCIGRLYKDAWDRIRTQAPGERLKTRIEEQDRGKNERKTKIDEERKKRKERPDRSSYRKPARSESAAGFFVLLILKPDA